MIRREDVKFELFHTTDVPDEASEDEFGLPRGIPPPMGTIEISFPPHGSEDEARAFLHEVWKWWCYLGQLTPSLGKLEQAHRLKEAAPVILRERAAIASRIMKAAENWPRDLDVTISFRRDDQPGHPPYVFTKKTRRSGVAGERD